MDQGDERLDEVFEEEREAGQEEGWYFDLPSGAWERQAEKQRRLRESLLESTKDRDTRDAELPRDPFTGQPVKRRRFGFGRKKDGGDEAAKKPRFIRRSDDSEAVGKLRAWRDDEPGDEDDWSTEPGAGWPEPGATEPPLLRRREREELPSQEEDEDQPRTRWDEMFSGPAAGGSIVDGMREWARKGAGDDEPETGSDAAEDGGNFEEEGWVVRHQRAEDAADAPVPGVLRQERERIESFGEDDLADGEEEDNYAFVDGGSLEHDPFRVAGEPAADGEAETSEAAIDDGLTDQDVPGLPGAEEDSLAAMRAWARGEKPASNDGSNEAGDAEDLTVGGDSEDEEDSLAAMRAWAHGTGTDDTLAAEDYEPAGDEYEDEPEAREPIALHPIADDGEEAIEAAQDGDDDDAGEPEPIPKRGLFSRLFGRKKDEEPEPRSTSADEELAHLVASTGATGWLDPDGEAGWGSRSGSRAEDRRGTLVDDEGDWVPIDDADGTGEHEEHAFAQADARYGPAESDTEEDDWTFVEEGPNAVSAARVEEDDSVPETETAADDAMEPAVAQIAGDAEAVSITEGEGQTDDEEDDPFAWFAAETEAQAEAGHEASAVAQDGEEQPDIAAMAPGAGRMDDEAWATIELVDDAELLEELVEEEAPPAPAPLADLEALVEEAAEERPDTADEARSGIAWAHTNPGDSHPWGEAAVAEDALIFDDTDKETGESEMQPEANETAYAAPAAEPDEWEWAPEDIEPRPAAEEAAAATVAGSGAGPAELDEDAWEWAPELDDEDITVAPGDSPADGQVELKQEDVPAIEEAAAIASIEAEQPGVEQEAEDEFAWQLAGDEPAPDAETMTAFSADDALDFERELTDEELEAALFFAEAYAEEASADMARPGAAEEVTPKHSATEDEELLAQLGWEEDIEDAWEAAMPWDEEDASAAAALDSGSDSEADTGERLDAPAAAGFGGTPQLQFDFASALAGDEPGAADEQEADKPEDTAWEHAPAEVEPAAEEFIPVSRIAEEFAASARAGGEAVSSQDTDDWWSQPWEEAEETPEARDEAAMPAGEPAAEDDGPGTLSHPWHEAGEQASVEPVATGGSLLSRFAAELSEEEAQETAGSPAGEDDGAPDLWAAIAEEAETSGEGHEDASSFDHPRVYGIPGQTSSRMSFYGLREDDEEPTPDDSFVPPEDDEADKDIILRAFEAHAATELDEEARRTPEPDPDEFDDLLGSGSGEFLDRPAAHAPQDVSYVRLHEQPVPREEQRVPGNDSWEPAAISLEPARDDRGGPPLMPYTDIDRPLPGERGEYKKQKTRTLVRELVETGLLALLVFLAVRASFQNFKVDGNSMYPTLEDGQFLIVNKLIYSEVDLDRLGNFVPFVSASEDPTRYVFHPPERGDIVVLRDPSNPNVDLIKRIVGMPGDKIEIYEGAVYINDFLLEEPYIEQPWHDTRPARLIPDGHYFVLGDNRDNSKDSRSSSIGFVPEELIVGRAELSYWPFSQFGRAPNDSPTISEAQGRPTLTTQKIERD